MTKQKQGLCLFTGREMYLDTGYKTEPNSLLGLKQELCA